MTQKERTTAIEMGALQVHRYYLLGRLLVLE
jgi:hypothetical protein